MGAVKEINLTFQEFMEHALEFEPRRSRGHAIHNLLAMIRRDLWISMRDSLIDPIEDDTRIEACLNWLEENWDGIKR